MAAQKINALTNLATPQPTMLMYAGLSPFGLTDDRKITANTLFSEITANVTDVSLQFGNGVAAAVSAAGKGKIIYNDTTKTFQVSADGGAYASLIGGSGANTRLAFWTGAGSLGSSANLTWVSPALTIGLASTATGLLTLANSAGATTTSFQAGNAAASLVYTFPTVSPTAGQVLSASAPSGANVTLSWIAAGGGGGTPSAPEGGIQFNSSSAFDADAGFLWDTIAQQLLIGGVALAGGQAPIDSVADGSAIAQQWREAGAGTCRIQMQIPASFGQFGTSSNHAFSLITNGTQHLNVEATGAVVVGSILTATGTLMSNAIATGDIALVANNAAGTTVDIARFQVNAGNRFRFLNTGEAIFGTASTATGRLTLANSAGATLTSISSGNAATTLNFIWPVVDPTVGQILSASAPSGANVTLSWVANGAGGIGGSGSTGRIAKFSAGTTIADSIMIEATNLITTTGRHVIQGLTVSTDADLTVASLTSNWTLTKNDTNARTFFGALFQPTFNPGGSNTATTVNIVAVDSTNTALTGLTVNLLKLSYGGTVKFNVGSGGDITFAPGVRQAFQPDNTVASLNVGQNASDPSSPVNGDVFYNTATNKFRAYENSAWVNMIGGGSSGITVGTTTITSGVAGSIPYNNAGVYGETNTTFASNALTQTRTAIATTPSDGLVLVNTTAAAAGAQQYSQRIRWTSQGWRTTATAATRVLDWTIDLQPIEGTTNPASRLVVSQQVNATGFASHSVFGISQTGVSYLSAPGGSETEWPGLTVGANFGTQASPVINGFWAEPGGSLLIVRPANRFGTHGSGFGMLSGATLTWSNNASSISTGTNDLFLSRSGAAVLQFGAANAVSPVAQTIGAQGSRPTTDSNVGGGNLTVRAGIGTGTGTLASLILQSPIAVGSGTGAQTSTTGLIIISGTAKLTSYTVAALPLAATAGAGATAFVTDANTTMTAGIGTTVVGGGANQVPVYTDGTNWIIG